MKKLAVVALAGLILVTPALFFPESAAAEDSGECFRDHMVCRENALNLDAPWYQVMLFLTLCDLALAKCILAV